MNEHAFPFDDSADKTVNPGMTLRDYFAAKAMLGVLAQSGGTAIGNDPRFASEYAYAVADAMLKAREQK